MGSKKERREYLRAELNVFINEDVKSGCRLTRSVDICEGGLRYMKPPGAFRREGKDVYLEFCLPQQQQPIRTKAMVVGDSIDESRHATSVVFTALSPKIADLIRSYVIRRKRAELFESLRQEHLDRLAECG